MSDAEPEPELTLEEFLDDDVVIRNLGLTAVAVLTALLVYVFAYFGAPLWFATLIAPLTVMAPIWGVWQQEAADEEVTDA